MTTIHTLNQFFQAGSYTLKKNLQPAYAGPGRLVLHLPVHGKQGLLFALPAEYSVSRYLVWLTAVFTAIALLTLGLTLR